MEISDKFKFVGTSLKRDFWRCSNNMSKRKAIVSSLITIALMYVSKILAIMLASATLLIGAPAVFYYIIAGVMYFSLFLVLLNMVLERIMHLKVVDFGILPFSIKPLWLLTGILLPLSIIGIYVIFVPGELIFTEMSNLKRFETLIGGALFTGIATGFVEEMAFRGVLLHSLEKAWNTKTAVIVSSFLFGIVHILGGGFSPVSCLMTVLSVTIIGIAFSLITIATGTVWNSVIVHTIWNFVFVSVLTISTIIKGSTIITYLLDTKSIMLTGGEFGIESSVISLIGYVAISIIAIYILKSDK